MKVLKDDIYIIINRIFGRQHPLLPRIMINWPKIVGLKFSSISYPLKISKSRDKGKEINILHIQVKNSSIALEMSFQQEIIIERIALYLGFKLISSMRVTVYNEVS